MSRIGKLPIIIPQGVSVDMDKNVVSVKGPKGSLERKFPKTVSINKKDDTVSVVVSNPDSIAGRSIHGTSRALIANMVEGVDKGFVKKLELVGSGYKAEVRGDELVLNVGYSHPVTINAPKDVTFKVEKSLITIEGIDKEKVGFITAKIRAVRPPEPYKGKGILYQGEKVRRKAGKAAATTAG